MTNVIIIGALALVYVACGIFTTVWEARSFHAESERLGVANGIATFLVWWFVLGYMFIAEAIQRIRLRYNFRKTDQ